jgi:hypothetical protein
MKLRSLIVGIVLTGFVSLPALSQNAAQPSGQGERERRGRGDAPGGFRGRQTPEQTVTRLNKELTLSKEQQDKILKLITDHQEKSRERMRTGGQNREKFADLRKQMEQARAAGDQEKIKTLEAQMRELSGEKERTAAQEKLMTDIEAVLTADQKPKFQKIKDDVFGYASMLEERPEMLQRAVGSLKLSKEKEQKIKGIFDEWSTKAKEVRDREKARAGAAEVYKKVMAELTPEEQAKVKAWRPSYMDFQRGEGRGAGPGGREREGRRGQGEGAKPPASDDSKK